MNYLTFKSEYDRNPIHTISNEKKLFNHTEEIISELKKQQASIISFETYPGVDLKVLEEAIVKHLNPKHIIYIEDYSKSKKELEKMLSHHVTDDRVFGVMSHHTIEDFYPEKGIKKLIKELKQAEGLKVVIGFGASLLPSDLLIHVSITRWEIQLRYRAGMPNFKLDNHDEDVLRKFKRGYFIEWPVADRIKLAIKDRVDYIIDYNDKKHPVMIDSKTYFESLKQMTERPFRMVPYFDPGVWGGQWMKEVCNLPENGSNYAWSFDGVPEENSIKLRFKDDVIHLPANDLVLYKPIDLMGSRVHARFGLQFPIRFDLLDTFEGGNLSLQVHPLTEYIYDKFGMTFTQDESYYILDAKPGAVCYLGFKEGVNKDRFEKDLTLASKGKKFFDADKYVNIIEVHKHDHLSIPAGTIHCSGKDTLVLEISTTKYIFTFKLWDWGRMGLDGKPRPVHLKHGFKNLQYDRDAKWVEKNLVNPFKRISEHEEITGLHEREFLETTRYTFTNPHTLKFDGTVRMANLVSGRGAIIKSPTNQFAPYEVHYAETFIIPANVKEVVIEPKYKGETCMVIAAKVR